MTKPYVILHLQLPSVINEQFQLNGHKSYYIIIWHGDFALADCYINSYDEDKSKIINQAISASIASLKLLSPEAREDVSMSELISSVPKRLDGGQLFSEGPLDISVVICTRNRAQPLAKCILSLLNQRYPPAEIIVVDNCPSDNATEKAVKDFDKVKYILEPLKGLDIARNTGAKAASCEIIAYTDDDVELHPAWCLGVWKSFQDNNVGAITGLVLAAELRTESQQIFEKCWSFNRGYKSKMYDEAFLNSTYPRVWDIGAGANMAFRRTILKKVNYFDERLDVGAAGCNGDSEMWFRILKFGVCIQYCPWVICSHNHRSDDKSLKHQLYYYMRGHVAAALIQAAFEKSDRYKKYVFLFLPKYYMTLLCRGFPTYSGRFRTVFSEIGGILSGIRYYHQKKERPGSINDLATNITIK